MWYALCEGRELRACSSCRRFAEHHPEVTRRAQTSWLEPYVVDGRCGDWLATPPARPPATAAQT